MVSYNIFPSPSNLHSLPLGIVPPPRQRVFPIFGTLQLLPFSHTSLNWYLFPKKAYSLFKVRTGSHFQPTPFSAGALRSFTVPPFYHGHATPSSVILNCNQIVTACYTFNKVPFRVYIGMGVSCVLVWRTFQAILYYHNLCKCFVWRFWRFSVNLYPKEGKTLSRAIFARLVTNNLFVIVVTLIITSFIWIVKNWCVILTIE